MKHLLLSVAVAVSGSLFVASESYAGNNIVVELSDEGVLSIVGERLYRDQPFSHPSVLIDAEDGILTIWGRDGATLNGQVEEISYTTADVTAISVTSIHEANFWVEDVLNAELSIDARKVSMTSWDFNNDFVIGSIVGKTTITNGRLGSLVFLSNIDYYGDVDITTGHGAELIEIGSLDNRIEPGPVNIFGNLSINTGLDTDFVIFPLDTYVEEDFMMECGQGDDFLGGYSLTVGGNAYLSGGQGSDSCVSPIVEGELIKIGFED